MGYSEDSKHIWERFENLERNLDEKVSNLEAQLHLKSEQVTQLEHFLEHDADVTTKNLASASRQASTYKNRIIKSEEEASNKVAKIDDLIIKLEDACRESDVIDEQLKRNWKGAQGDFENISIKLTALDTKISSTEKIIAQANTYLEGSQEIGVSIKQLESKLLQLEEMDSKSKALHQAFSKRKTEIDEFYYEFMGQEDDLGIAQTVKKEAKDLLDDYELIRQSLVGLEDKTKTDTAEFFSDSTNRLNDFLATSEVERTKIFEEIKALLPSALTAGLSSAYEEKVEREVNSQSSMSTVFYIAVVVLLAISTLPFITAYIANAGTNLKAILNESLQLLPLMIPMYLPVLWVAYSTNKRINLSKRLIEEYTHKGVLNKTFKGLSDQIDAIGDTEITGELRTNLLFNLLSASSENPGKLISDYNSSDHPLMDALDKSAKLANSIEVLSKVPGFSKIVKKLDDKSKKILSAQESKVSAVLDDTETESGKNVSA